MCQVGDGAFAKLVHSQVCFALRAGRQRLAPLEAGVSVSVLPTMPCVPQSQMKAELAAVASEFGRLTRFLAEEQAGLERRLRDMHEAQLGRAGAAASRLTEQAAQLSRLLAEAQERSQQGGLRLLQVRHPVPPSRGEAECENPEVIFHLGDSPRGAQVASRLWLRAHSWQCWACW